MPESTFTPEALRELRAIDLDWQKQLRESIAELAKVRAEYEDRLSTEREKNTTSRFSDMDRWLNERATAQQRAIDAALESQEKKVTDAFEAAKEAVATATITLESRLGALNELRGNTLERTAFDQFLKSYGERHESLTGDIAELRQLIAVGPEELQKRADEQTGVTRGVADDRRERRTVTGLQIAGVAVFASMFGGFIAGLIFIATGG